MAIFEITLFGITIAPSYYGLMYALGFIIGFYIIKKRGFLSNTMLDDLFTYVFIGVILGGRLGYILFYNFSFYLDNFLSIFKVWEGGMSFHGGAIGVFLALLLFARKKKINFLRLSDEVSAVLPIGLGLGRIGNYLNKELLGYSPYDGFLAVEKDGLSYFPSPLLESLLEGLALFIILYFVYKYRKFHGQVVSIFLIGYGAFRIFVEIFFRTPDVQIGYIMGYFTMGEILSLPMIIVGGIVYYIQKGKIINA